MMWRQATAILSLMVTMSLGIGATGVQAQSGSLEPPGSAVNGSGEPVATTQTQPSWDQNLSANERFKLVLGGEAVLDKETGLVWEQSPSTTEGNWVKARFDCAKRTVGGRHGWRLPSMHELASLLDPTNPDGNPDLPIGHPFSNVRAFNYWSGTTSVGDALQAWTVDFSLIGVTVLGKGVSTPFWCVRGGGTLSEY